MKTNVLTNEPVVAELTPVNHKARRAYSKAVQKANDDYYKRTRVISLSRLHKPQPKKLNWQGIVTILVMYLAAIALCAYVIAHSA